MRGVQTHHCVHGESVFPQQPRQQPQHQLPSVQPLCLTMQETQQVAVLSRWTNHRETLLFDLSPFNDCALALCPACLRMTATRAAATQWKDPRRLTRRPPRAATATTVTLTTVTTTAVRLWPPWWHHCLPLQCRAGAPVASGRWSSHQ